MLGQRVTLWRESFTEAAHMVKDRESPGPRKEIEVVDALAKKIRTRGTGARGTDHIPPVAAFKEPVPIDKRKRCRSKNKLSVEEKITIVHQVICQKFKHADIAKEHRITHGYVSLLALKASKNRKFIEELLS